MNDAMQGIEFFVVGVVNTDNNAYIVLVDESSSLYFPVQSGQFHAELVECTLAEEVDFDIKNYGMYFTLLSMFKAHGMAPVQAAFMIDRNHAVTCSLDVVENNELGIKLSRIPLLLADAVVISSLGKIPIVVYGVAGTDFAFKIDKAIPRQNVFSVICEEIVKSERMSAIRASDDQE